MEQKSKYYNIEKENLAMAMNFLGFHFYKFYGDSGFTIYGFENTDKFRKAFNGFLELRKTINK